MKSHVMGRVVFCAFWFACGLTAPVLAHEGGSHEDLGAMSLPLEMQQVYEVNWQQPLGPVFQQASDDFKVPVQILLTLGQIGSAFENRGGAPTIERGYGVMALRDNTLGGDSLALAAQLTNVSVDQLKLDPVANIRGAAAVLDQYARDIDVDRKAGLEAWTEVVVRYAALDPETSRIFAAEAYKKIERGFALTNGLGEAFNLNGTVLSAAPDDLLNVPQQIYSVEDYAGAPDYLAASCNYSTATHGSDTYVIHTIEGSAAGCLSWFRNCAADVSANYVAAESGSVWRCVPESYTAWTQGCYNSRSVSTEHEGYASSGSHPQALYDGSGLCVRDVCNRHGIPKEKRTTGPGVIGHIDVSNCCCGTHTDPGGGWNWSYFMSVVNGVSWTNPPYLFGGGGDGWAAGNSATGIAWTGASNWGGSIYFDQTGNDCFIFSPGTNLGGPSAPQMVNVDLYPQSGTTNAHDMQLFWKTNAANSFTADKSSPIVNYTAQNAWATVNLSVNNSGWWGQTINQLRLDFDNTNHSTRFIINHIVLQDGLWWHFSSDGMGWSIGNNMTGLTQTSCCGWPGVLYADQSGPDAILYSPVISGGGWPFNYLGGVNDWIKVRVYPQSGTTPVHDMAIYWITSGDGTWNEAKSTHVTFTGQNQWVDVNLPVGKNANWPAAHVTRLRLDFDQVNHGNRWIVDAVSSEHYGTDSTAPTVPTTLAAAANGQGEINLTWNASTDAMGVNGYKIYRNNVQIATSVAASYKDASGAPATTYTYEVAAYDASGNTSGKSNSASATTSVGDTQPPTIPQNLAGNPTSPTSVHLTWNASTDNVAVTGYDIRRNGAVVGSSATNSYTDNAATADTTQSYDVRAKDAVPNYSDYSDSIDVTTPPTPPTSTVVFSDGFNGNLNNWTQQVAGYAYSTTVNKGGIAGGGAAFMGAGETDQMFHTFTRPFAQAVAKAYFWDGKGGWKPSVCGWAYRTGMSVRDTDNAAKMFIDNEIYNAPDNAKYYYRQIGTGGGTHTIYATRDANTDCAGAWIGFETDVNPGAAGASPVGTCTMKVTDRSGTQSVTQNLTTDYFGYGIGRMTIGLGVSSANEGYWDDVTLEATPPGKPTMTTPTALSASQIKWNFTPADNNHFGWDVLNGNTVISPAWPNAGWLDHNASSWTETGLAANTAYTRKVKSWNGSLDSSASATKSGRTLSPVPSASNVTPDSATPCSGSDVTWTAVGGFGAGYVEYYHYAWDQSPTYTFTGSEDLWSSGTLLLNAANPGNWYLHLKGYNADDVANGTYDAVVTAASCDAPIVSSAISRRAHGGAGTIDLDVSTTTVTEDRSGGPTQVLVTFSGAIAGVGGLDNSDVAVSSGSVSGVSISGSVLTVSLSGATDTQKLAITFPGIMSSSGNVMVPNDEVVCFGVLVGDANGDGAVDIFDLVAIRNMLNQTASAVNFRSDVIADGTINIFDLVSTRNNLNKSVGGICPSGGA